MKSMHRRPLLLYLLRAVQVPALALLLLLPGCQPTHDPAGALTVTEAYIPAPPPGVPMAAGYFRMKNSTGGTVTLRGVASTATGSIEMHETRLEDGVSKMRELSEVSVGPGEELVFEPGGRHLMFLDLPEAFAEQLEIPVTLEIETADGVRSSLQARFRLDAGGTEDHSGHAH